MIHQQLWAPWRLAYISGDQKEPETAPAELLGGADPTCFICRAAVAGDDRQCFVVERSRCSVTLLNRYPYNNGHLLIAPKRHVARLDGLEAAEQLDLVQSITQMVALLERTIRAEGFNVGLNLGQVAGAGLPGHVHWHVVPRWHGDTNFMPALAGVRVIPQSLEALWQLLTDALGKNEASN